MGNFNYNNIAGKIGEKEVKKLMNQLKWKVEDKSGEKSWQTCDTDFLCTRVDESGKEKYLKIEAKADTKAYENILCETVSNTKKRKECEKSGWVYKTQADFVCMYKSALKSIYIMSAGKLREYVDAHYTGYMDYEDYALQWGETTDRYGKILYESHNMQIPIVDLVANGILLRAFRFNEKTKKYEKINLK
jgi:hypothetical protein